jgi:SAM-dependent methyltransferase
LPTTCRCGIRPTTGRSAATSGRRELCDELIAVDIAENAVAHCRERCAGDERVSFHVNDGTSLAIAADRSVDVVFSFDSLVHAERDVLGGYLQEFVRVLTDDGVAFIHHSNTGAYEPGTYDPHNIHWRATTVSAELVERLARADGLGCMGQETVAWGNETILNDCLPARGAPIVTVCTGTRDADDMWRAHSDNTTPAAWNDMLESLVAAVPVAERHGIVLGIEPESGNVVRGAAEARRLLDEIGSTSLSTVVAAGRGELDYERYIALLAGARYAGPLVLHGLAEDEVASSVDFLRRAIARS